VNCSARAFFGLFARSGLKHKACLDWLGRHRPAGGEWLASLANTRLQQATFASAIVAAEA
jgi:hypothetical protein